MSKTQNKEIITEVNLYITRAGRIAFLQAELCPDPGRRSFSGYVYNRRGKKSAVRQLEWLASGQCINSDDDGDWIVRMA